MINAIRQFFASGQPVRDDVAALKAEAAMIAAGWKPVPQTGTEVMISASPSVGHGLRPGSASSVTVGAGGYSNGYAQAVIAQAQQVLNQQTSQNLWQAQAHYNAQLQSALQQQASHNLSNQQFSQNIIFTSTAVRAFATGGGVGTGSFGFTAAPDRSPIFDPNWLVTYYEHRENAQVARIVEET